MVNEKIVDDYYQNQEENRLNEKKKKKIKLNIRGKVKIKKMLKKEENEKSISKKTPSEKKLEEKTPFLSNDKKEKSNKIKVVVRKKKTEEDIPQKTPIKQKRVSVNRKVFSVGEIDGKKIIDGGFEKIQKKKKKDFVDKKNKKIFFEKKDRKESKKFSKKTKKFKHFKEDFFEEDFIFSRSNKLKNIKKEEKKVEDIVQNLTDHRGKTVIVPEILSVKELSEKIGIPFVKLITEFLKNGMKVTINSKIDFDTAVIIGEIFGVKLKKDKSSGFGIEHMLSGDISSLIEEDDSSLLSIRPSVISIMGHVDHGKTSLLDYIRKSKIVDKEAGGITQSIGAYQIKYNDEKITFLDTPGHEAFTIMRARGAKSTDIAVLVVAADEGVKPQTIESINHANEAGISIIVALNKIDKEGINIDFVKGQLSEHGLQPEDWGGKTPMVPISAKTGAGVDELLDMIVLMSELLELKANANRNAVGTILESHLDMKLGPVCTVLINTGTLRKGDSIVCKGAYGKVKVLKGYNSRNISEASPSTPVLVVGFNEVCEGGDIIQVVSSVEKARLRALEYKELINSKKNTKKAGIDLIMSKIKSGNLKQLKVVVKSDTNGSLEVIKGAMMKLSTKDIRINIIHSGVGNITEGDVLMCQGSSSILIGFGVDLLGNTKNIIENTKVEYISSKIIYKITEKLEKIITGMYEPKEVEVILGEAVVGGIFFTTNDVMILGLKLKESSKIFNGNFVKIIRDGKILGRGEIINLKSGLIDINELEGPTECGIKLKTNIKIEMKDILEIYKIEIEK